ncbi:MAG TPA: HAMP domain-containing sensor histidine kinase [Solirubrobacteraceae bacterium]|nr:HAMP domain-containing sensor histidine kinase [Solirubrobacteraceae bacterium]
MSGGASSAWAISATAALVVVAVCAAVGLGHHRRGAARLARCAHELRGPLGALRLGLDLALARGELSGERLAALDLQLARAVLALAELEGAPVPADETVELPRLVTGCVASLTPLADRRGVSVEVGEVAELRLRGSRAALAQALSNLIANAIEHGGGEVIVRARAVPRPRADTASRLRLEVQDSGPGLPRPLVELLRVRQTRREHGHGLAVAAAVAEGHGGRLLCAPARRGARMVLELPAAGAQGEPRAAGAGSAKVPPA